MQDGDTNSFVGGQTMDVNENGTVKGTPLVDVSVSSKSTSCQNCTSVLG